MKQTDERSFEPFFIDPRNRDFFYGTGKYFEGSMSPRADYLRAFIIIVVSCLFLSAAITLSTDPNVGITDLKVLIFGLCGVIFASH